MYVSTNLLVCMPHFYSCLFKLSVQELVECSFVYIPSSNIALNGKEGTIKRENRNTRKIETLSLWFLHLNLFKPVRSWKFLLLSNDCLKVYLEGILEIHLWFEDTLAPKAHVSETIILPSPWCHCRQGVDGVLNFRQFSVPRKEPRIWRKTLYKGLLESTKRSWCICLATAGYSRQSSCQTRTM